MTKHETHPAIFPYQWELLAAMITYKVSDGLCLDINRINGGDFEKINKIKPSLGIDSLYKWFNGRKPKVEVLNDFCDYIADVFPYHNWQELITVEKDHQMMALCPDWKDYVTCLNSQEPTQPFFQLNQIRKWAYLRVILLAKRDWSSTNVRLQQQVSAFKEYEGVYKLFMPGQIPPVNFDAVYVNPVEIRDEGKVLLTNGYTQKIFSGYATIKESEILQVILYPADGTQKEGFEYAISIKLNRYGRKANYFPGNILGFNGDGHICCYPVLLSSILDITIDHPLVTSFFKECGVQGLKIAETNRMNCLTPSEILAIIAKISS